LDRLRDKVVIITGAASGIGEAVARLFAKERATLVLADVAEEPLRRLAGELGEPAMAVVTNVSNEASMQHALDQAIARHGRLDVAVLNAGIGGEAKPLTEYSNEVFDRVFDVNVRGVWFGLRASMRAMQKAGGSIIVTCSTASIRATPNVSAYVASKHAALGLVRAAAIEGAKQNIRVNAVNPSTVDTPLVRALASGTHSASSRQPATPHIPMGRTGEASEVAAMMLFLASDESSYCTGGAYMVDGGVSAGRAG
jgi:NAD(P)-dependent dehydrogenase (short-subunit alcohol dehydrogenase family)